jgi:hypothetical protein
MTYETEEQQRKRLYAEFLRRLREAPPGTRVEDHDRIEIEDECCLRAAFIPQFCPWRRMRIFP